MDGELSKAVIKMIVRCFLCIPVGAVVAVLMISVIGIPIAIPLGLAAGAWCTKPLRDHPQFNVNGDAE
jgi:hypothetical protein